MHINRNLNSIVTGGASGLGAATVRHLASLGANPVIFDLNEEAGSKLAEELNTKFYRVDVTSKDSIAKALDQVQAHYGDIHILVNCAGIAPAAKTTSRGEPHSLELFEKVIDINLVGTFRMIALVATRMSAQSPLNATGERGVIINTASIAAFEGQMGQAAYAASKNGIVGLTLPVARDLARNGIRVNTIAPGLFVTQMLTSMPQEVQDALEAQALFPKRLGQGEDYAHLVQSICENEMLNGETIRLDGGIRLPVR
ncbi:3-hydroxyacyl-CoA dehydrogenase [Polycladidibacter stylochi]|uniref:3-hydroxyacyl-CoA dehydrogenase n=1 Tax=Polycladidibacter stylochi TaxID=1807766 RepID=UPI0008340AD6|nr:3-hydroxyacyl-CoA dehydrogenase [Pseudovibrio stylochi]